MFINISNGYPSLVNVAIGTYNPSCDGQWESQGWWALNQGDNATVTFTCNRYAYFYAEAADGAYWAGDYDFQVAEGSFDFCPPPGVAISAATVGMREIDSNIGPFCWIFDFYFMELVP